MPDKALTMTREAYAPLVGACPDCGNRWVMLLQPREGLPVQEFTAQLRLAKCPRCGNARRLTIEQSPEALAQALLWPVPDDQPQPSREQLQAAVLALWQGFQLTRMFYDFVCDRGATLGECPADSDCGPCRMMRAFRSVPAATRGWFAAKIA